MKGVNYMELKHVNYVQEEVEKTMKYLKKTNLKAIATVAIGAGIYIAGKSKGHKIGMAKGLATGYHLGVSDMVDAIKEQVKNKAFK